MATYSKLLFYELGLFGITQALGIFTALRILQILGQPEKLEMASALSTFLIAFLIATGILLVLLRFIKSGWFFQIGISFLVLIGAAAVFSVFLPDWISIVLAAVIVVLRLALPNVLTHNTAIILGVSGVCAQLGLSLSVWTVIILMILLSVYDYIAVFKTKHMVEMFKGLMRRGVPMSIIIPAELGGWKKSVGFVSEKKLKTKERGGFVMLGTGDLAFPLILAVSALETSLASSLFCLAGSLFGVLAIHLLLKKYRAIPALPPLTLFSVLGYLVSLLLIH